MPVNSKLRLTRWANSGGVLIGAAVGLAVAVGVTAPYYFCDISPDAPRLSFLWINIIGCLTTFFVGPSDLALSLGVPGEYAHPKVVEAVRRVVKACEANGLVCGTPAINPEHCKFLIDQGVRYLTDGSDWRVLLVGFQQSKKDYAKLGFSFRPCTHHAPRDVKRLVK